MASDEDRRLFSFWYEHTKTGEPITDEASRLAKAKRDIAAIKKHGLPIRPVSPYGGADIDHYKLRDILDNIHHVLTRLS